MKIMTGYIYIFIELYNHPLKNHHLDKIVGDSHGNMNEILIFPSKKLKRGNPENHRKPKGSQEVIPHDLLNQDISRLGENNL